MSKWAAKMGIKLVLGHIPYKHQIMRKLGIFKHGEMDDAEYCLKVFNIHKEKAYPDGLPKNFTALELGPGDSLASALLTKAYGASRSYHVDVGAFASQNIEDYKKIARDLKKYSVNTPDIQRLSSTAEMLDTCNAQYLSNGLESLKTIADNSVDFIWSHSVVEHIRKKDFNPTMRELARILKPYGRVSHSVDLQDHFEKSLNNLRFSEAFWENEIVANSGFYTNRIQYTQSVNSMKNAGFSIVDTATGQWDTLPLKKEKMHKQFQSIPDDELRIRTYHVVLKTAA